MLLGDNIKKIRLNKGLSINKLWKQSEVTAGYISAIERNEKVNPSKDILKKLANALNVTVDDFYMNVDRDEMIVELNQVNDDKNDYVLLNTIEQLIQSGDITNENDIDSTVEDLIHSALKLQIKKSLEKHKLNKK